MTNNEAPIDNTNQSDLEKLTDLANSRIAEGRLDEASALCDQMMDLNANYNQAHALKARSTMPGENYGQLLARLHEHLQPAAYVEIGVATGASMAFAAENTACVGIDPNPRVTATIRAKAKLYPITSDAFFDRYDLLNELGAERLDLAFIDGLHLFEQALRDFINVEKYSSEKTVVLIHDCNPPTELSAARDRTMAYWCGDVWRLIPCLRKHRPDLMVSVIPALPSGIALVTHLDKNSTHLEDSYDEIVAEYLAMNYSEMAVKRGEMLNVIENNWDSVENLIMAR